jgi:aspartate/methionine/tyrosine aminotransferase
MNGSKPKALLLLQPNNPTGRMLSKNCLQECLKWACEKDIHLISNEVYAISVYEKQKMLSMAQVWFDEQSNKKNKADKQYQNWMQNQVHITGGLSKDFGINGFAIGFIFTQNQDILAASRSTFGMLHQVSSHTQFLMQKILEDQKWLEDYVKMARKRLTASRTAFKDALQAANIPLFESQGTLMGWVDMRAFLVESSWEAENALWEELYKDCGWMIKRGREFATSEPGWFCVMLTSQTFQDDDSM